MGRAALLGIGGATATVGTAEDVVACTRADCAQLASSGDATCTLSKGLCVCHEPNGEVFHGECMDTNGWGTVICELRG